MKKLYLLVIVLAVTGCFKPIVYLQNKPNYPVDVFYDNQRPDRPFATLQDLEVKGELPLSERQSGNKRMLSRGNDMQQKELIAGSAYVTGKADGRRRAGICSLHLLHLYNGQWVRNEGRSGKIQPGRGNNRGTDWSALTHYPFRETIKFTVTTDKNGKGVEFPFHLRIPDWCTKVTVSVNGQVYKELPGNQTVIINQVWK